jgi:predicted NBD/HSP70 family sugar kinase
MEFYVGLDVSLEATSVCVVNGEGTVVREAKLPSDPDAIELFLAEWGVRLKRVGLEAFSFSAWLFAALDEKGLPVVCVETRHAKAAMSAMLNKTDRNDARGLAQMMRAGWFRAVHVKSREAQALRMLLAGRKAMLGQAIDLENMIRGLLRPFGLKVGQVAEERKLIGIVATGFNADRSALNRSRSAMLGPAVHGRARPRTAPTATDTAHPRAARTIQRTRVQSARRGSHPPCSRRRVYARRPEIPPESWSVSMTGAGKLSPGPQPVMETRPRSHSRASRAHLLRYAAPTGGEHPQKNSA